MCIRDRSEREKLQALLYLTTVNGYTPDVAQKRTSFEDLVPIFPNERDVYKRQMLKGVVSRKKQLITELINVINER